MKEKKRYNYYFPENLRYARLLDCFDRKYLASLTGFTMSYVQMMLKGKRRIPNHLVPLFELLLGLVTATEIYANKEIKKSKRKEVSAS